MALAGRGETRNGGLWEADCMGDDVADHKGAGLSCVGLAWNLGREASWIGIIPAPRRVLATYGRRRYI